MRWNAVEIPRYKWVHKLLCKRERF